MLKSNTFLIHFFLFLKTATIISICTSCSSHEAKKQESDIQSQYQTIIDQPAKQRKNYLYDPYSSLISRVEVVPDFVLAFLQKMDNKPEYEAYLPNDSDRKIIEETLLQLPHGLKAILEEKLLGIYFITNLWGSGFTEWVVDEKGTMYNWIAINPNSLTHNLSEYVTIKENTCFIQDDPSYSIEMDLGERYSGLLYILLHESTHVMDYNLHLTPYVEVLLGTLNSKLHERNGFVEHIWNEFDLPAEKNLFPEQKKIHFYGFGNGPSINVSDAVTVYQHLEQTDFVTLYGSMNWAEDIAEWVTFYHLTQNLKVPFTIRIKKNQVEVFDITPMQRENILKRKVPLSLIFNDQEG